jgi:hypothetical protein
MSGNDGYSKAEEDVCEDFRWGPMDFGGHIHDNYPFGGLDQNTKKKCENVTENTSF